jgi:hypothetical protein
MITTGMQSKGRFVMQSKSLEIAKRICQALKVTRYAWLPSALLAEIDRHNGRCEELSSQWEKFYVFAADAICKLCPGVIFEAVHDTEKLLFNLVSERIGAEHRLLADQQRIVEKAKEAITLATNDAILQQSKVEQQQLKQVLKLNGLTMDTVDSSQLPRFEAQARQTAPYQVASQTIEERRAAGNDIGQLVRNSEERQKERQAGFHRSVRQRIQSTLPPLDF